MSYVITEHLVMLKIVNFGVFTSVLQVLFCFALFKNVHILQLLFTLALHGLR